jgi:hypothetical protein
MRQVMISEFVEWLRTRTNRHGRPFQLETISAYQDAAVALSGWMTSAGLEADFTGCDTAVLNRFFRWYHDSHSQGGVNTKQRNPQHLFSWLAVEYGHPHPYTDALVRYAPVKSRPSTLAAEFIKDLLEVTGGGRARDFENARDHAMIRVLTEGVRRAELVQLHLGDLPVDLIARPYVRVVPLKGGRASEEGRIVPLTLATARAIDRVTFGSFCPSVRVSRRARCGHGAVGCFTCLVEQSEDLVVVEAHIAYQVVEHCHLGGHAGFPVRRGGCGITERAVDLGLRRDRVDQVRARAEHGADVRHHPDYLAVGELSAERRPDREHERVVDERGQRVHIVRTGELADDLAHDGFLAGDLRAQPHDVPVIYLHPGVPTAASGDELVGQLASLGEQLVQRVLIKVGAGHQPGQH